MRTIIAVALVFTTGAASAQEMKEGWGFQFRQDTFDKAVIPVAMMSQEGDGIDKSLIAFTCGKDGKLVSFFQVGLVSFDSSAKVQFRDGDDTKEVTYTAGEVAHMGKRLVLDPQRTTDVISIFERADGADVPFRTGTKQGSFSSIAAKRTLDIVRQNCGI